MSTQTPRLGVWVDIAVCHRLLVPTRTLRRIRFITRDGEGGGIEGEWQQRQECERECRHADLIPCSMTIAFLATLPTIVGVLA